MKICNRKLAKRIKTNEGHMHVLCTVRIGEISQTEFQAAKQAIQADIDRDIQTLAAFGFDKFGRKVS
jgi:hypothetical protein